MKTSAIISDKEIMGGTLVFRGTRVPVQTLFDYIDGGDTIDDFLEGYPSVKRKQVHEVIKLAEKLLSSVVTRYENIN